MDSNNRDSLTFTSLILELINLILYLQPEEDVEIYPASVGTRHTGQRVIGRRPAQGFSIKDFRINYLQTNYPHTNHLPKNALA